MAEKGPELVEKAGLKAEDVLYGWEWVPLIEESGASRLPRLPELEDEFERYIVLLTPSDGVIDVKWGGEEGSCCEEFDWEYVEEAGVVDCWMEG